MWPTRWAGLIINKATHGLAIDLLEEAVIKAPPNATYHYHLGLAYQKTNDRTYARTQLQRVLQIDPNYNRATEIRKALAKPPGG